MFEGIADTRKARPVETSAAATLAVDLGSAQDFTAIALVRRLTEGTGQWVTSPDKVSREQSRVRYEVNRLRRLPLGMSWDAIAEHIADTFRRVRELDPSAALVVDSSGLGAPIVDLFRRAGLNPVAITITGHLEASGSGRRWSVPRNELLRRLEAALHVGELTVAGGQEEAEIFRQECRNIAAKYLPSGALQLQHVAGKHDDVLMSVALGLWWASRARQTRRITKLAGFH